MTSFARTGHLYLHGVVYEEFIRKRSDSQAIDSILDLILSFFYYIQFSEYI